MSFMSLFEETSKAADGMALVNKLRHVLQGRSGILLKENEKAALLEALTINNPVNFSRAIIYNLQGSGDTLGGAIPTIGQAFADAFEVNRKKGRVSKGAIKRFLESEEITEENRKTISDFLRLVMEKMDQQLDRRIRKNPLDIDEEF